MFNKKIKNMEKICTEAKQRWENGGKEIYEKYQADPAFAETEEYQKYMDNLFLHITVELTPKLRLEQALTDAGIENPATIVKLTVNGTFTKDDSRFIWKNMRETLKELDMGNTLVKKNTNPFNFTFPDLEGNYIGLTSITIPQSVTKMDGCLPCLKSFAVHPNNPVFASEDGVLFNKDKTKLIAYPQGAYGDYVIPDSVTEIAPFAFYECVGLTSVFIPKSVAKIDLCIATYMPNLQKIDVTFAEGVAITVHPDNPSYTIENGKLMRKVKTKKRRRKQTL